MDTNYVITRLKNTVYKFPTAEVLQKRIQNLGDMERQQLMSNLKIELWKERNVDIYEPLHEMMVRSSQRAA